MNSIRQTLFCAALVLAFAAAPSPARAQDIPGRKELGRADLSGAPGMEVILSVTELKPGYELPVHLHHGIEAVYVLEGGMVQAPGKPPFEFRAGTPVMNLRDAPHGLRVVGDRTIRLVTVHVVDKGKPLFDFVKK